MAEPSAFQVVVRLRPVPPGARHCVIPSPDPHTLLLAKEGPSSSTDPLVTHQFVVDRVFGPTTSQPMFYTKCIHPVVSAVVQGFAMAGGVPVGVCPLQAPEDLLLLLQSGQRSLQASRVGDGPGHTVVTLLVQQRHGDAQLTSRLHFVRLAASDRVGEASREESVRAQKAFAALSSVVSHVAKGSTHIPYRDSRLTSLLRDTLNRHSLGLFICTLQPVPDRFPDTLRAAKYTRRIKQLSTATAPSGPFVGRFDQFREQFVSPKGTAGEVDPQPLGGPPTPASAQFTTQPPGPPQAAPPPGGPGNAFGEEDTLKDALDRCPSPASTVDSAEEPQPYQYSPKMYTEPDRDDSRNGGPLTQLELEEGFTTQAPASPPVAPLPSPPPNPTELFRTFDEPTLLEFQIAKRDIPPSKAALVESAELASEPPPLWLTTTSSAVQQPTTEVDELRLMLLAREAELQAQHRELDTLRTELIATRQGLLATRAKRYDHLQELEPLRTRCLEEATWHRRAEGEAEHWKAEVQRLTAELTEMRQTVVTAKHQLAHLTDTIRELQVANKGLQESSRQKDAEMHRLEELLGDARAEATRLQAQVADLGRQLVQLPDLTPLQPLEEELSPRPSTSPHLTALERQLRTVIEERDALADDLAALHRISVGGGPASQGEELHLQVLRRQYTTVVAERRLVQRSLQACRRDMLELQQEKAALAQALLMAQRLDPPPTMSLTRVQSLLSEYHRLEKDLVVKALQLQEQHEEVQLLRLENSDLQLQVQLIAHESQDQHQHQPAATSVEVQTQLLELQATLQELKGRHGAVCEVRDALERRVETMGMLEETVTDLERQLGEVRQSQAASEAIIQQQQGQLELLRDYTSSLEDRALSTRQALERCRSELRQRTEERGPSPPPPEPAPRPPPSTAHEYHRLMTRAAHLHETLQAVARMVGLTFTESIADVEDCRTFRIAFQTWLANRPASGIDTIT
eukprot:GGOE01046108.1.p1 GENE.GGOE01046108.1~~GGOE01046108.1.p1  ORF type:complete len:972 (-),score=319.29 GGOE01046108.1:234-3149(-)